MPAPPPVRIPGWYQMIVNFTSPEGKRVNTFNFFGSNTPPISGLMLAAATAFYNATRASMKALQVSTLNLDDVRLVYLGTLNDAFQAVYTPPQPDPGQRVLEGLPANVACTAKLKTALMGRKYRGKSSFTGFTEDQTLGSSFLGTTVTGLAAFYATYLSFAGVPGFFLVPSVASRVGLFLNTIIAIGIDTYTDSQRRRLIGRGR